ncbi:MAG: ABC transporter substrate-binding protein, partial [Bacteroidota bacterium]
GTPVRLYVYDVNKDTTQTRKLLKNPELKKMDLVIGLLYHRNFQIVSGFCLKNHIPIVNPVSERESILTSNPMVIKTVPSTDSQIGELAAILSKEYQNQHLLIVKDPQFVNREMAENLKKALAENGVETRIVNTIDDEFTFLSKEKKNVIVVFSENRVFALELFTKLNKVRNDFNMTLFGLPRWDKLEAIEPEYLVNLRNHQMVPSFVDYNEPEVKKFVARFQELYKTDPDNLAFQGFDIAAYFISALRTYGKTLDHCISTYHIRSLQTHFEFEQTKGNGFENHHWEIFMYENYRMKRVKSE